MAEAEERNNTNNLERNLSKFLIAPEVRERGERVILGDPENVRFRHRMGMMVRSLIREPQNLLKQTNSNLIFPSKVPIRILKRARIVDLCTQEPTKGVYIIVRTLETGFHTIGWTTVIEDHAGAVCILAVYNYPPDELFAKGTILIIKEPFLKTASDESPMIRCDCPTDIIVLHPSHRLYYLTEIVRWRHELRGESGKPYRDLLFEAPVPRTADDWKHRGNCLYLEKNQILAAEAYRLGLHKCTKADEVWKYFQLNLTSIYFKFGHYEKTIEIADMVLEVEMDNLKALMQGGKAHYCLRQYSQAENYFIKVTYLYPENEEGKKELKRVRFRLLESAKGLVDIADLRAQAAADPGKKLDCADYVGPVDLVSIPNKGRGLVLREDVEEGRILMVSKAIAATLESKNGIILEIHDNTSIHTHLQRNVTSEVAQLIAKNPNAFGPMIYDLYSGKERDIRYFCDPELKMEPISDVALIRDIVFFNIFTAGPTDPGTPVLIKGGSGLFVMPSYMNHSCVPNTRREIINDVMIVYARRNLKAGDEILTSYISLSDVYEIRQRMLTNWNFTCRCSRCRRRR